MSKLTVRKIETANGPTKLADEHGLYLRISPKGAKTWIQRLTIRGRRTDNGIGHYPATGSAAVALVGAASVRAGMVDGSFDISIRQGIKVGRPSFMRANSKVIDGKVVKLSVGGATHVVASGEIEVGDKWLDK